MSDQSGKEAIYGPDGIPSGYLHTVQLVSALSLLLTIISVVAYLDCTGDEYRRNFFHACWVWWVVVPPAWFSYEYFTLYKRFGQAGTFEAFKYGQDVAAKAWIAISAVLTVIASK